MCMPRVGIHVYSSCFKCLWHMPSQSVRPVKRFKLHRLFIDTHSFYNRCFCDIRYPSFFLRHIPTPWVSVCVCVCMCMRGGIHTCIHHCRYVCHRVESLPRTQFPSSWRGADSRWCRLFAAGRWTVCRHFSTPFLCVFSSFFFSSLSSPRLLGLPPSLRFHLCLAFVHAQTNVFANWLD